MKDEYFHHAVPSALDGFDIPLGLGNTFSNDISALLTFAQLPLSEQRKFLSSELAGGKDFSVKLHEKTGQN